MQNDQIQAIAAEIVRLKESLWRRGMFKGENPVNKLDAYPVKPPQPKPMPPPVAPIPAPPPPTCKPKRVRPSRAKQPPRVRLVGSYYDRHKEQCMAYEREYRKRKEVKKKIALRNKIWYSGKAEEINKQRRAKYAAKYPEQKRKRMP